VRRLQHFGGLAHLGAHGSGIVDSGLEAAAVARAAGQEQEEG
jgi:hypothetical protein